jgi:hypothetical protein
MHYLRRHHCPYLTEINMLCVTKFVRILYISDLSIYLSSLIPGRGGGGYNINE